MIGCVNHDCEQCKAQSEQEREWVGLSVFEINDLIYTTDYDDYRGLVEATEAKLKAKNSV